MKSASFASLALLVGLSACPAANSTSPTSTMKPLIEAASTPFTIGEMKFFLGDDLGLQIHADGKVEQNSAEPGKPAQWVAMGKLTPEGVLLLPDNSEAGRLLPDGTFKSSKGEVAPFKFEGDALVVSGKHLTIDDKGLFQGGEDMGKPLRVEGVVDGGSRRAALFVLALAFSGGSDDGKKPGEATPPAP